VSGLWGRFGVGHAARLPRAARTLRPPRPTLSERAALRWRKVKGHPVACRAPSFDSEEDPVAESYTGEAYCVKCKEKRDFTGEVKVSESGRRMAQGICPVCGTKLNRILGKA
jgi:hypothetical protein